MKDSILESDEGILFPEKNLYNFTELELYQINLEANTNKDNYYAKIYIYLSRETSSYKRYYIKLVDILAKVGGVFNVATVVIEILYSFFIENEFYIVLYNKIFKLQADEEVKTFEQLNQDQIKNNKNFEESNNKLQEKELSSRRKINVSRLRVTNQYTFNKLQNKDLAVNKELEKIVDYKSKKRKNVQIHFLERARFYCCCKNPLYVDRIKCDLIQNVYFIIRQRFEIFELFKQLNQFRLTAKLLLNENQCFMLQNIGRKLITNEFNLSLGSEEFCKHIENKHNLLQKNLLNYLKDKKQNNLLTNIDLVLYRYLDLNTDFKDEADKIILS